MFKKIFNKITNLAKDKAEEIAIEKTDELINNIFKKKSTPPTKTEAITPEIIYPTNSKYDDSKYKDPDDFEKQLNKDLIDITKNIASNNPTEALKSLTKLGNMAGEVAKFTEVQKTKRKEIEAQRDIIVEGIKSRKEIILYTLEKTFDEREMQFKKYFDIVDEAISKNNIEQLNLALGSINHLAALSPFKALENLDSTQKALMDKNHTWDF